MKFFMKYYCSVLLSLLCLVSLAQNDSLCLKKHQISLCTQKPFFYYWADKLIQNYPNSNLFYESNLSLGYKWRFRNKVKFVSVYDFNAVLAMADYSKGHSVNSAIEFGIEADLLNRKGHTLSVGLNTFCGNLLFQKWTWNKVNHDFKGFNDFQLGEGLTVTYQANFTEHWSFQTSIALFLNRVLYANYTILNSWEKKAQRFLSTGVAYSF